MMRDALLEVLYCPACHGSLSITDKGLCCKKCDLDLPVVDGIPRFNGASEKAIIEFDVHAVRSAANWTGWRRNNYDFFSNHMKGIKSGVRALDIGAGTSPFAALSEQFDAFSVDIEPYRGIDFTTDMTGPLPLMDESFDLIIMSNLLEHIPEPMRLVEECYRILKKGGTMLMTVPFIIKVHQAPYDFMRYTEYMLLKFFDNAGFSKLATEKIGNLFDVHDQISSSLYKYLHQSAPSGYITGKFITLLYRINNLIWQGAFKVARVSDIHCEDTFGYPHGYGVVAVK